MAESQKKYSEAMEHIRALPVPEEFKGFIFKFLFVHQFKFKFVRSAVYNYIM